jgi:hypothetical protein
MMDLESIKRLNEIKGEQPKIIVKTYRGIVYKVLIEETEVDFEVRDFDDSEIKVLDCDEELIKQSGGDKFFVSYANDTKLKTFKTEELANEFKKELEQFEKQSIKIFN